jgi:hypothetical protein
MANMHTVTRFDQIPVWGVFTRPDYRPGLHVKNSGSTSRPYRGPEPEDVYGWYPESCG